MIKCGDIVKRKGCPSRTRSGFTYPIDDALLFYDGYFLVIDIITNEMPCVTVFGNIKTVYVYKIMDCMGITSWISGKLIYNVED